MGGRLVLGELVGHREGLPYLEDGVLGLSEGRIGDHVLGLSEGHQTFLTAGRPF